MELTVGLPSDRISGIRRAVCAVSTPAAGCRVWSLLAHLAFVVPITIGLTSCDAPSKIFSRLADPEGYWLPLTVDLRMDSSVTEAGVDYVDACRRAQRLPIGDRLKDSLRREIGMVFERVRTSQDAPVDGALDVALGLMEIDLLIPRQGSRSYPATMTLGATVTYIDSSGAILYTKNLRVDVKGTVQTEEQDCRVQGLAALASEAVGTLTQGLKKHLGTSTNIREAARERRDHDHAASVSEPKSEIADIQNRALGAAPASAGEPTSLSFRVMLRDGDGDQLLESGETISIEMEVHNAGSGSVKQIFVNLSGTPTLVSQFTNPIAIGDLQPGEIKHLAVRGVAPDMAAREQAELILSLETRAGRAIPPTQKKFQVTLYPDSAGAAKESVDVDRIPERIDGYERQKAVGIAIGVSAFRNSSDSGVPFAARDAEVMAKYFQSVGGISSKQIRLATNDHVLKEDLVELFEEWLPGQVVHGGTVFVFIAGRAFVNPSTGAVSLIPYEADSVSSQRLYSFRRLYDALARLPMQRAVLLMDLLLTEPSSGEEQRAKAPAWDALPPALRGDKVVQLIGVTSRQEAHQYAEGRHGLFTYFLLKGLGGAADFDQNGMVVLGELCGYVREHVLRVAQEKFDNAQEPACVPSLDRKSKAAQLALSRVK
jgi:hypothetical protein